MPDKDIVLLEAVMQTLDSLTVSGRDNLVKVIGCMNALKEVIERNAKTYDAEGAHG